MRRKRCVSHWAHIVTHVLIFVCRFFAERQLETIQSFSVLNLYWTLLSLHVLSHELLLQGFCHSWHPPTLKLVSNSWEYFPLAATAAKSLQSCPTLCDPIDGSTPASAVPGILQTRTLEWVAISFSSEWKWKVKVKSLSRVLLFATPCTATYQVPPSMGFSRQEYWMGCLWLNWLNWTESKFSKCPLTFLLKTVSLLIQIQHKNIKPLIAHLNITFPFLNVVHATPT